MTVPPPGTSGTRLVTSSRRTTSTPGVPGPPMNLCGDRKIASLYAAGSTPSGACMSMSTYGAHAAKSQKDRAPCWCSKVAMPNVSDTIPVTLLAARERPDLERPVGVPLQLGGELGLVDVPVGVLADRDDVGDRLAPGELVGVVLEGADEDDRPLGRRDLGGEVVAVVELGRDAQAEDADELVDGRRWCPSPRRSPPCVSSPPTWSRMIRRASSRRRVVCSPVPLASVCVLA